jgi:hypothetical protein
MEHLDAAGTSGSPVLKHGPMPPAAEEGVNALGFWNAVARGDASAERAGAGHMGIGRLVDAVAEIRINEPIDESVFDCEPKPGMAVLESPPVAERMSPSLAASKVPFELLLPEASAVSRVGLMSRLMSPSGFD